MTPDKTQEKLEQLKEENRRLKQQLFQHKTKKITDKGKVFFRKLVFTSSSFIFGRGLRRSLSRLYDELPNRVRKDTMAEVSSHVIWRVTRIGMFALCAAVIPIFILLFQTTILSIQNDKLDYQNQLIFNQNKRLDQQVQLDEGNRRSSFIFLMSNVMDKIDEELKSTARNSRRLSDELIGRIAALSQALLPYRYLENDKLIRSPLSPERGQLLFALINSLLDEETYDKIFEKSNFSHAELKQANFSGAYLRNVNLEYAHFPDAVFSNCDMEFARLNYATLSNTHFEEIDLKGAQLRNVKFQSAEIVDVDFENANLSGVDFSESRISGYFTNCRLDGVRLGGAEIEFALLDGAHFQSRSWLDRLNENNLKGLFSIRENYTLEPEVVILSSSQTDTLYRLKLKEGSSLAMMGNCEKRILSLVKSAPEIKTLVDRTKKQGERIIYLTEANPFGSDDLGITKDSVYLFRITTENADLFNVLMWAQFNPQTGELFEMPLTEAQEPRELAYSRRLWRDLPNYCN